MQAVALVQTVHGKRYLGQVAKHFAHKIPVELVEDHSSGKVVFSSGTCRMLADPALLRLELEAEAEAMADLKDVVVRHLVRFAFREELLVEWNHVVV